MSVKEDKDNGHGIELVSEKDEYLWAYLSLKSDLNLIENLNEQFSKFVSLLGMLEIMKSKNGQYEKELKDYRENIDRISKLAKKRGLKRDSVLFPIDTKSEFNKRRYESIVRFRSANIIRDMSLVYVVALFEGFLQNVFQISFKKKPETLRTCQKNMTYEELLKFKDINDAKSGMIEKEIMIVNEDIEDVRQYIRRKFNIEISEFVDWKELKERFYRRNVLIHNSGMPNKLYRLKTRYKGKTKRLTVSKDYLTDSINLFNLMSLKVGLAFEAKIRKD